MSADIFISYDFLRITFCKNLAFMNHVGPFHKAQRLTNVVIGDENADAPLRQVPDKLLDIADGLRVDACERLVKQHEGRP